MESVPTIQEEEKIRRKPSSPELTMYYNEIQKIYTEHKKFIDLLNKYGAYSTTITKTENIEVPTSLSEVFLDLSKLFALSKQPVDEQPVDEPNL